MALKPHEYSFGDWEGFEQRQQQKREELEMQQREEDRMKKTQENRTVTPVGVAALIHPTGSEVARSLTAAAFEGKNPTKCGNRSCVGFQRTKGRIVATEHPKGIDNKAQTLVCPYCTSRWQNVSAVRQVFDSGKK